VPRVAESGVATAAEAGRIAVAGYELALVGTALMEALEPLQLVRAMLSAGRNERARRS
jgi:indole-3-glycerol phosphate synthase